MGLNIILPVKTALVFALGEAISGQPISRGIPQKHRLLRPKAS